MSDKCPKCGAGRKYQTIVLDADITYLCESWRSKSGKHNQSYKCERDQLRADLDRVTKERDKAREQRDRAMELLNGALRSLWEDEEITGYSDSYRSKVRTLIKEIAKEKE